MISVYPIRPVRRRSAGKASTDSAREINVSRREPVRAAWAAARISV